MALSNPFSRGVNELIESDSDFLELFEPAALEFVPWDRVFESPLTYWASGQGEGKSTFLRVFTPAVLWGAQGKEDDNRTKLALESIGALADGKPRFLGVHIKGTVSYEYISHTRMDDASKRALFLALLNARLIQRFVRALCAYHKLPISEARAFTYDLHDVEGLPSGVNPAGTASELQEWARTLERECLRIIEGSSKAVVGHLTFAAQRICDTRAWTHLGEPIEARTLLMIDDGQEMTREQRACLTQLVTREREGARTWLAVRSHALERQELLEGASGGRDYFVVRLEYLWRDQHPKHYDYVRQIVIRRIARSGSRTINNLQDLVQDTFDRPENDKHVNEVLAEERAAARKEFGLSPRYQSWLRWPEQATDVWQELLRWRELRIFVARDANSGAGITDVLPLSALETRRGTGADTRLAALAQLSDEYNDQAATKIPQYFGFEVLAYIGLHNVQLMLRACEILYDQALENDLRKSAKPGLDPRKQDQLLRAWAEERWRKIPEEYNQGEGMQRMLQNFVHRISVEFEKMNAPYAPAPVGLGIPKEEYEAMSSSTPPEPQAVEALSRCLEYNQLLDSPRHHKSAPYRVFFLSPIVLIHHGFPVRSRQFQPTTLQQLGHWMRRGFEFDSKPGKSQASRRRKVKLPSTRGNVRLTEFDKEPTNDQ